MPESEAASADQSAAHPPELGSRLVETAKLAWSPTRFPGIEVKVLYENKDSGLLTALFRWQPGAVLPLHEHVALEQTYVLEGSLEDDDGVVTAGNYVARPAGSRHIARAPQGATILAFFLRPNVFLGEHGEREVYDSGSGRR